MTTFSIELVVTDNRFVNPSALGSNISRKTIYKGSGADDHLALSEAERICGKLESSLMNPDVKGRKFRTWTRFLVLHVECNYNSALVVTFKSEL